jgi:hypothetical protein
VINQQGRPFNHGFEWHMEKGTIQFEFAAFADGAETMPLKILTADGGVERPLRENSDELAGFVAEIEEVRSCVTADRDSDILGATLARDAIAICQMQAEAVARRNG